MKVLQVKSKVHGIFEVLLDDEDYIKATTLGKTSRWCVRFCKDRNNLIYFQKRLSSGKLIELHRFIMGFPEGKVVDHINGNTLDNRKNNLRVCLSRSNVRKGKIRTNNTSGYTGVKAYKNHLNYRYLATIRVNYKVIRLGWYNSFNEAVKARKQGEIKYYDV
jgi:hypothetical protein